MAAPIGPPPSPEAADAQIGYLVADGASRQDVERMHETFEQLAAACKRRLDEWSDDDDLAAIIAHDAEAGLPGMRRIQ